MRRTAVFQDDLFLRHDPGPNHPERVDRLTVIYDVLAEEAVRTRFLFPDFEPADSDSIEKNHSGSLLRRVSDTSGRPYDFLDQDTATSEKSYEAALLAAGSVIRGVDLLVDRDIDNGFALVRPPGHHAERDRAMGFCLFNNVAVAAHHALAGRGLERVMIVDWDLHHGNGTQFSFYDSSAVLYLSTHQFPYYPGTGSLQEVGLGDGEGYTVNVPLPGGMGDEEYAAIFNDIVIPVGRAYAPELLLVSAGFDIYHGDPLGSMRVGPAGFAYMTRALLALADEVCDGRLLVTLEGGYNLRGQRDGALAVLTELLGAPLRDGQPDYLDEEAAAVLAAATVKDGAADQARRAARRYWDIG